MKMLVIKTDENGNELERDCKEIIAFFYKDYEIVYVDDNGYDRISLSKSRISIVEKATSKTFINK